MFTNIIQRIFQNTCDILYPKRTSRLPLHDVYRILTKKYILLSEKQYNTLFLYRYADPYIRKIILEIKRNSKYTEAHALCVTVQDHLIQIIQTHKREFHVSHNILIYVPSSAQILRLKKFDHMEELLRRDTNSFKTLQNFFTIFLRGIEINEDKIQKSQHSLSRTERMKLSKDKFKVSKNLSAYISQHNIHNTSHEHTLHIYCIDDVTTTGATFGAIKSLFTQLESELNVHIDITCIAIAS